MATSDLKFLWGREGSLPTTKTNGTAYFATLNTFPVSADSSTKAQEAYIYFDKDNTRYNVIAKRAIMDTLGNNIIEKYFANVTASGNVMQFYAPGLNDYIKEVNIITTKPVLTASSHTGSAYKITVSVNGVVSDAFSLSAASSSKMGLITTGTQTFAGTKTFNGTVNTSLLRPRATRSYSLGDADYVWSALYQVAKTDYFDTNGVANGSLSSVAGTQSSITVASANAASYTTNDTGTHGFTRLYLGNDISLASPADLYNSNKSAAGTYTGGAGNSQGILRLYGPDSGYAEIFYASSSEEGTLASNYNSNAAIVIPHGASGSLMLSAGNIVTPGTYDISFQYENGIAYSSTYGFKYQLIEGTTGAVGESRLILGNSTAKGTAKNAKGSIQFYNESNEKVFLMPSANVDESTTDVTEYTLYLPAPAAGSGTLVHHATGSAVGSSSRPVYIDATGKATAISKLTASYGGTGRTSLTAHALLIGNGTSAVTLLAAPAIGKILVGNGTDQDPVYMSPEMSWVTETSTTQPQVQWTINGVGASAAVPYATGSVAGLVSTAAQTFGGAKTFSDTTNSTSVGTGAVIVKGGLGVAYNLYAGRNVVLNASQSSSANYTTTIKGVLTAEKDATINGDVSIGGDASITKDLSILGGDLFLGGSNSQVTITSTGTDVTILFKS